VRSLWDDSQDHLMSGVLMEGRYRIEDVRSRTAIRSEALEKILGALNRHGIPLAAQPLKMLNQID
jgi:hypothetical protein